MACVYSDPRWISQRSTIMSDVAAIAAAGIRSAVEWYRRPRQPQTLGRLTDRELVDLGLHRSQLPSLAHGADVRQARYRHAVD